MYRSLEVFYTALLLLATGVIVAFAGLVIWKLFARPSAAKPGASQPARTGRRIDARLGSTDH